MNKKLFGKSFQPLLLVALAIQLVAWSCKKVPIIYSTTDEVNITGYLDAHLDSFSSFRQILSVTGYDGFLSAYGHYTLFLPTNAAVATYLQSMNKSSVDQVDVTELKDMVKFHLLQDTVYSISFTDGKLPQLTMYGQYLVTGASFTNGETRITVNRQASIIQSNLRMGNGVIHVIDHVLEPAKYTLAEKIEKDGRYGIFTEAMKATGLYDTLNILPAANKDTANAWFTVLAESDSVFHANGIQSYAALKSMYNNTANARDPEDSLHMFVAYHILHNANYLADIISSSSFNTLAPLQVITSKLAGSGVLINDDIFNGIHEPGIVLNRNTSDLSATNGVLHEALGPLSIKVRSPFAVYWDVCMYPEIMSLPSYYGRQNYTYSLTNLPSFITDPGPATPTYTYGGSPFVHGDYLLIPLGANRTPYVELKTPLLVQGKYKVWICFRRAGRDNINQVSIDGIPLQRTINFATYIPSGTDAELEAQGWKHYTDPVSQNWQGFLAGTIDIQTTGQHALRFTNLQGTDNDNWLDMIHFIPVDMDQLYPRFQMDGTPTYAP